MISVIAALALASQQPALTAGQVAAASTPIRTVDPADTDFRDLGFLKKKIGNARVVFLGEQSHGDGQTFLGKDRLIRFLHEQMGFDVLAWESGLYDCREMDRSFLRGDAPLATSERGLFRLWAKSEQVRPLFEYVAGQRRSKRPLVMAGFDCQFSGKAGSTKFFPEMEAMFEKAAPGALTAEVLDHFAKVKTFFVRRMQTKPEEMADLEKGSQNLLAVFRANKEGFSRAFGAEETRFREQCLKGWVSTLGMMVGLQSAPGAATNNVRDAAMAENFRYMADHLFKGKKMIVWAASFHNLREPGVIDAGEMNYAQTVTFGKHLVGKYPSYNIAFTGYEGEAGVAGSDPFKVQPAPDGSLEQLASTIDHEYLFIDLSRLPKRYVAQPLGYSPMMGDWGKNFDAVLYTRTLKPSTLAAPAG